MDKYQKILVCHYGKVASTSLVYSLGQALNYKTATIKSNKENFNEKILVTCNNYNNVCNYHIKNNDKILVISMCRNLIDRWISMHFQLYGHKYIKNIKNDSDKNNIFKHLKSTLLKKNTMIHILIHLVKISILILIYLSHMM